MEQSGYTYKYSFKPLKIGSIDLRDKDGKVGDVSVMIYVDLGARAENITENNNHYFPQYFDLIQTSAKLIPYSENARPLVTKGKFRLTFLL